jgi:hypothetical protein
MKQVTDRLVSSRRRDMIQLLNENGHVDFTVANIHAIVLWILKNANEDIDGQLCATFEKMNEKANVHLYKSNKKVFDDDRWRYNQDHPTHVALEYRLVLHHCGGIKRTEWDHDKGLDESGCEFLQDLLTVANNLGFVCDTQDVRVLKYADQWHHPWKAGEKREFHCTNNGTTELLFEVRAFYNWNIHIRLSQNFALALNVEHGRLKGWIKSPAEAVTELQDMAAAQFFNCHLRLAAKHCPQLTEGIKEVA